MSDTPDAKPIDPERLDVDADDATAGGLLYGLTLVLLLATLSVAVWLGWRRAPLLGWPVLLWAAFVPLRLWKTMLRGTVEDVSVVVDHAGNVFDDTTPTEALQQADADTKARHARVGLLAAVPLVALHTAFIVLVWYGVGRGARAVAGLF